MTSGGRPAGMGRRAVGLAVMLLSVPGCRDGRVPVYPVSGQVLCRGRFDETQESVMENLFNFSSARKRGFTWVTAEEMLREGLQNKLSECPYLR